MNLEKLNTWLSLLANIGVLAGILFLALELNQSNLQAQSDAYQARTNEIDQSLSEYALSETLPSLVVKVKSSGVDSLTPEEFERINAWERARLSRMWGQYYQYELGFLDRESYNEMVRVGSLFLPLWQDLGLTTASSYSELLILLEAEARENNNE